MSVYRDTAKKYDKMVEERIRREAAEKSAKQRSISDMEKELGRLYIGSLDIDNDLKVKANVFADPDKWKYKVNITYKINGKKHFLSAEEDMSALSSPTEMNRFIRSHVLDSLARVITNETFKQNQRTYKSISKEYTG
tara:strand:+ start:18051 stop:18461 length:411 start_codon:yes stop_codon:yes gene_type:complete